VRVDVHFYGMVAMPDAGAGPPEAADRRYANSDVATTAAYGRLCHWAGTADRLGYDTMWLTEHHFQHHFQYEGYEVTPNLTLFGVHLAGITERLRFGQMFNVVSQWHPLRLAEDFAMADVLTGGRRVFGVGRGTVPREAQTLGAVVASGDNALSKEADRVNRELFEESMDIIVAAWGEERFSYSGKHFTLPPPGIPDRGATVTDLSLVPRPLHGPGEIFQPVGSPATLRYVAQKGFTGVFAMAPYGVVAEAWDRFADEAAAAGWPLAPGEGRCLQIPVHVATSEAGRRRGRAGHDELVKFLAPYGRFAKLVEGAAFDFRPSLEQTVGCGAMAIGSVEEEMDDQLALLVEEGLPRIGVQPPAPIPPGRAAPTP